MHGGVHGGVNVVVHGSVHGVLSGSGVNGKWDELMDVAFNASRDRLGLRMWPRLVGSPRLIESRAAPALSSTRGVINFFAQRTIIELDGVRTVWRRLPHPLPTLFP